MRSARLKQRRVSDQCISSLALGNIHPRRASICYPPLSHNCSLYFIRPKFSKDILYYVKNFTYDFMYFSRPGAVSYIVAWNEKSAVRTETVKAG